MVSPETPDYSGAIDPHKVRRALLRYHFAILRIVSVGILVHVMLLYFLVNDILVASTFFAGYLLLAFCMPFMTPKMERKIPIAHLPECAQPDTPIYHKLVLLWTEGCRRSRHAPGSVYVVYPIPNTELGHVDNFGTVRPLYRSDAPPLFIAEQMFHKLSHDELCAGVHHEIGHLQSMPLIFWFMVDVISLPMTIAIDCVSRLRASLPKRWKIPRAMIRGVERFIHTMSTYAAHHADEYCADIYAVAAQNTAEHLALVLTKLQAHRVMNLASLVGINDEFIFEENCHLYTHPLCDERIRRLLSLRKDRS